MLFPSRKRSGAASLDRESFGKPSITSYIDRNKRRKRTVIAAAILLLLAIPSLVIIKSMLAYRSVLQQHTGISSQALRQPVSTEFDSSYEAEGRVNILLLGVGDYDHAGALLADTAMVASVDPKTKDVALLSLPRDLYVAIPSFGRDKLNAAHSYGEQKKVGYGPDLMKEVVAKTLDIPIHNYIRVDFTGFSKAIDTLGGVTIQVEQPLFDPEYPCVKDERYACGFQLAAGQQKMNGATALKFARCRKGNCGNDFGRAARQQQVLVAAREKALSASTLANPTKLMSLIDTFGSHVRTDLSQDEITKLAEVLKDVDSKNIHSSVVDAETENLVQTANIGGASVVIPQRSDGKFLDIQSFTHKLFFDRHIVEEGIPLTLIDASGSPLIFNTIAGKLEGYRYALAAKRQINQQDGSQMLVAPGLIDKYSVRYLQKRFKVTAKEDASVEGIQLILGSQTITEMEK